MDEAEVTLMRSTTPTSTAGEKLRYARERKGFSQQEAASALCLPITVIDALERDDYDKLPAPVFIVGYLKNYAKFLGIPVSDKDAPIPAASLHKTSAIKPLSLKNSSLSLIAYILLKSLNYIVFIGLLLLVFLWWHERHHAAEKIISINNLSIQKAPFPRDNLEPVPPDLRPWLDDVLISTGKNQ